MKNINLVKLLCTILDELVPLKLELKTSTDKVIKSYQNLITFVTDRPGHDMRYAMMPLAFVMSLAGLHLKPLRQDSKKRFSGISTMKRGGRTSSAATTSLRGWGEQLKAEFGKIEVGSRN